MAAENFPSSKLKIASMVAMALGAWWQASPAMAAICNNITGDTILSNVTNCQSWTQGNVNVIGSGIQISGSTTAINANAATLGTLTNSGTISTPYYGIRLTTGTSLTSFNNSGLISGSYVVDVENSTIDTLSNSGTITGYAGIYNTGTIHSLTNTGRLIGTSRGVDNNGGVIDRLNNSGFISGNSFAITNQSSGTIGTITNSGVIAGNIQNDSSAGLTINGGGSSLLGTLTGSSGGIGSADIGTITHTASNLTFGSGNLLLNDSINATGRTVNNTGATLQVNNQINITGAYHQGAAATLQIGVGSAAQSGGLVSDTGYGRLIVSGNVVIDSGSSVTLKPLSYNFAVGQRFVVVQAGSATYNESTLNYSASGFSGSVAGASVASGGTTNLVLTLSAATPSKQYATDAGAISALKGLFNYGGINTQLLGVFNPARGLGDAASANRAGAQLNPAAVQQATAQGSDAANLAVLNVAGSHLDGLRVAQAAGSGIATGERSLDPALWGQFFGGGASQDDRDGVSGYHSNYRGLLIGGDVQATDNWRTGGLFSYAKTNLGNDGNNTGSSASVNSYGLTAYAGYDGKPWYVNLTAGIAQQQYSTVRAINYTGFSGVANGNFNGLQSSASVQAGYPLALSQDTTLTPLAGLTYSKLRQNGYTESGGNGAALNVNAATTTSLKGDLGARLERKFDTAYGEMRPSLQLRWRHEFQNSRLNTGASFAADASGATAFTTTGAAPLKNTGVMAVGITLARSKNMTVAATYTLEAGQGYTSQTGDVRLRWQY